MRVLVTGGAGFIGSAVCRHFVLELGHEVVVVDKLTYAGNLNSLAPVASNAHYTFEKLDICDAERPKCDLCELSAGCCRPSRSRKPRRPFDFWIERIRSNQCRRNVYSARSLSRVSC